MHGLFIWPFTKRKQNNNVSLRSELKLISSVVKSKFLNSFIYLVKRKVLEPNYMKNKTYVQNEILKRSVNLSGKRTMYRVLDIFVVLTVFIPKIMSNDWIDPNDMGNFLIFYLFPP